jgi:hypothetical protein
MTNEQLEDCGSLVETTQNPVDNVRYRESLVRLTASIGGISRVRTTSSSRSDLEYNALPWIDENRYRAGLLALG